MLAQPVIGATGGASSFFDFFGVLLFGFVAEMGDCTAALVGVTGATLPFIAAAAAFAC
jgi:hypothetical protein